MAVNQEGRALKTWVEVDRARLKNNFQIFKKLLKPECRLLAVAKSNAYGHNLVEYALEMEALGVDFIGVDSVLEGLRLRERGVTKPILVFGYTLPDNVAEAARQNISLTVSGYEALADLAKYKNGDGLKLHLKFDTGMCRQGFFSHHTKDVLARLKENAPNAQVEGVYTHFAGAKNPAFPAGTNKQIELFEEVLRELAAQGLKPIRHAGATAGAIVFPEAHYDMVRVGIGLMGLWPSEEVEYAYGEKLKLQPALSWRTVVSELKMVPAGNRVGYDGTEFLERKTRIAILPVGYWHGFPRALSSLGRVLINGRRARVLGRVSMDILTVDVTDIEGVEVGDTATLIGQDGFAEMTAAEMGGLAGTSHYEIVTRLNPLMERIYT